MGNPVLLTIVLLFSFGSYIIGLLCFLNLSKKIEHQQREIEKIDIEFEKVKLKIHTRETEKKTKKIEYNKY